MNNIPQVLKLFIEEYQDSHKEKETVSYDTSLAGEIAKIKDAFLEESFLPSLVLKSRLDTLVKRAKEPIEIAIIGHFSSGKSTFLNALLAKDMLPMGITPVTSKVNYIHYGEVFKLQVTYHSGKQVYHSIEQIAHFTDQRKKDLDEIKYLSIFAPIDILKEISFVDTPGLNSQSHKDSKTTKSILKDVGGIIWLTLIDNAGKQSEQKILDEYMSDFKDKTLCVLNQKDKFNQKQITQTTAYIEEKFSKYFSQVTPISAKLALEGRLVEKDILIDNALDALLKRFKNNLHANLKAENIDFLKDDFNQFKDQMQAIEARDMTEDIHRMQESNIEEVLNFINNSISPNAKQLKTYRIKSQLQEMSASIIHEYERMLETFDCLYQLLDTNLMPTLDDIDQISVVHEYELTNIQNSIVAILQKMSNEIYLNIETKTSQRYETLKSPFLKQSKINQHEYQTYSINTDQILKNLFYDHPTIKKMEKQLTNLCEELEESVEESLMHIYMGVEVSITEWEHEHLLFKKNSEITSDLEVLNLKKFISQSEQNILKYYHTDIVKHISHFNAQMAHFNASMTYSTKQVLLSTIAYFEKRIRQAEEQHKNSPSKFTIRPPKEEDILKVLEDKISFYKVKSFLSERRNVLYRTVNDVKQEYEHITQEKMHYIKEQKKPYEKKIEAMKQIQVGI